MAAAVASEMYSQYGAPAYAPPAQPLHLPAGYIVAPPTPIQLSAPKPTTTTFLIRNAEAPPKPSLPKGLGGLGGMDAQAGAGARKYGSPYGH